MRSRTSRDPICFRTASLSRKTDLPVALRASTATLKLFSVPNLRVATSITASARVLQALVQKTAQPRYAARLEGARIEPQERATSVIVTTAGRVSIAMSAKKMKPAML